MIRKHALGFRTLLMLVDGGLAAILLGLVSFVRFGGEWYTHWLPFLNQPAAFAAVYAGGWVIVLWLHGLYRPQARWTFRSESLALVRASMVMVLMTLSVLFVFRLPDISRSFLVILFPAQWAVSLATRIVMRMVFIRMRARGFNLRYVLMIGAGPRAQAFAAKLEAHRELGLRVIGFLDDEPQELPNAWRYLGLVSEIEHFLHEEVIDEVAVCLPFSQWDRVNAIAHVCEEEGKIVRVPVDVLDRAFAASRVEEIDGTPVYSMITGPDRIAAFIVKRLVDVVVAGLALVVASPLLLLIALWIRLREGPPVLFRQTRVGLHGRRFEVLKFRTMSVDAEARYLELVDRVGPAGLQVDRRSEDHGNGSIPAWVVPRRAAAALERAQGRDVPRRSAAGTAARG